MTPSRSVDGRGLVTSAGLVLAQLGVCASALVVWWLAGWSLSPDPIPAGDHLQQALGLAVAAGLLLLGIAPALVLRVARGVLALGIGLAAGCGVLAVFELRAAATAVPGDPGEVWWWPAQMMAWLPTTWPMVLLVAVSPWAARRYRRTRAVTGGSSPAPPRPPGR